MNCKPGDLAITHSAPLDNGLVVEVIERPASDAQYSNTFGPCWIVRSSGSYFHIEPGVRSELAIWPDAMLRPIRDPGEDAECESKAWLPPVPNTTKETA
jgi:hypothetical protein